MNNKRFSIVALLIVMVALFGFNGCKSSDEAKNIDLTTLEVTRGLAETGVSGSGYEFKVQFEVKASALGEGVTVTNTKLNFLNGGQVGGSVDFTAAKAFGSTTAVQAGGALTSKTLYITSNDIYEQVKIEVTYRNSKNETYTASGTLNIKGLYKITYRVTGVKRASTIMYRDHAGKLITERAVNLPFTRSIMAPSGQYVSLYASNDMRSGNIKVEMLLNDKVVLTDEGRYSARVSGTI